jgi:hypothetical protein
MPLPVDHRASRALSFRNRAIELAEAARREDDKAQRRRLSRKFSATANSKSWRPASGKVRTRTPLVREYFYPPLMSALSPKADMCGALAYVCFGPKADIAWTIFGRVGRLRALHKFSSECGDRPPLRAQP